MQSALLKSKLRLGFKTLAPRITTQQMSTKQIVKKKKTISQNKIDIDDDLEEWKKSKMLAKPKDQVELQDYELKEVIGRVLVLTNKQVPSNIVQFNYGERRFCPVVPITNYVVVYERQGTYIHVDSDAAMFQFGKMGIDPSTLDIRTQDGTEEDAEDGESQEDVPKEAEAKVGEERSVDGESGAGEHQPDESEKDPGEEGKEVEEEPVKSMAGKKLTNQFNFCERAALTYNLPTRTQETQTVPPPIKSFSANVLQWIIYDAYQEDFELQQVEKEKERERKEKDKAPISKTSAPAGGRKGTTFAKNKGLISEAVQGRVLECWKVLERMCNLNTFDDIAKDFRYWEDPSDEYREEEGTLLPLWKYNFEKTKKHTVTYLCWNPWYYDLFAVCYGYLDFLKPIAEGYVCLFTVKNPSYPETICYTSSAVMCCDIHPKYPYMLLCGLYDGNIEIFNVQATTKKPAYTTTSYDGKHSGIVWSIKWVPDLPDGELNFFSIGSDGKVNNYVLMQNELALTTMINLYLEMEASPGPDGTLFNMKACASYIVLHPAQHTVYLVGTEEGTIYKCSTNYSSQYLFTYAGHHMPIYKIDYNKFNPDIFVTCSGDWRIKIWEDNRAEALFVFDLGSCISDVAWAPYSSTVFAAATVEGKVYVFDLNVNKYKAICVQAVVSKKRNKLTTVAFNHHLPIVIVGDDKGTVTSLKLSPNLRVPCKPPKKQQNLDQFTLQCMKLDRLLSLVREPQVLQVHTEAASEES